MKGQGHTCGLQANLILIQAKCGSRTPVRDDGPPVIRMLSPEEAQVQESSSTPEFRAGRTDAIPIKGELVSNFQSPDRVFVPGSVSPLAPDAHMTLVDLIRRSLSLDRNASVNEPVAALSQAASLEHSKPDQSAAIPEGRDAAPQETAAIRSRVFSRVGLLGNPSDGFGGRCISFSLANFSAEVALVPSDVIRFLPNPEGDPETFGNLGILTQHLRGCGYYGGIRILMAMCKRFFEYCQDKEIALDSKNFALSYTTTIPRQSGLSGSSAIALAALNCLLRYYKVEGSFPVAERPGLVLSAEQELGITAGLQDRVIQVYGGLLLMDFDPGYMAEHGHARLASLDPGLLPSLFIIYPQGQPGKDSGTVHSYVKERWLAGDPSVRAGMAQVAALVEPGWEALLKRDYHQLASLMRLNFRLRRQLYGDAVLGPTNLKMVQVAESVGAAPKLTGSGGAVVVVCPEGPAQEQRLADACAKEGLACVPAEVGPVNVVAA